MSQQLRPPIPAQRTSQAIPSSNPRPKKTTTESEGEYALRCVRWAKDGLALAQHERLMRTRGEPYDVVARALGTEYVRAPLERAQHDPVEDTPRAIVDSFGLISRPTRVVDLLERWRRAGHISQASYDAGVAYRTLASGAQLEGLRAADIARVNGGGRAPDPSITAINARQQLTRIARYFRKDPIYESVLYWVIGQDLTLAEFARRQRWGSGGSLTPETAADKLRTALSHLADFYAHSQNRRART